MDEPEGTDDGAVLQTRAGPSWIVLIAVPLLIILAWTLENYLLAGRTRLFMQADVSGLAIYTALSGILVGILVPVVRIRAGFLSGAVNMFHLGFRSLRRTVAAVSLTALACYTVSAFLSLSSNGADRWNAAMLFCLLLPTTIAAVMLCWVLTGTHAQAYVRSGGIIISVLAGILLTTLVFAIAMSVVFLVGDPRTLLAGFLVLGCICAFFFFAVRDIYATVIVLTAGLTILVAPIIDPAYLADPVPALCGFLSLGVLVIVHAYFSRHYTTVMIPETNTK